MKQELIDALIGISGKDYVFFAHEDIEGYLDSLSSASEGVNPADDGADSAEDSSER